MSEDELGRNWLSEVELLERYCKKSLKIALSDMCYSIRYVLQATALQKDMHDPEKGQVYDFYSSVLLGWFGLNRLY